MRSAGNLFGKLGRLLSISHKVRKFSISNEAHPDLGFVIVLDDNTVSGTGSTLTCGTYPGSKQDLLQRKRECSKPIWPISVWFRHNTVQEHFDSLMLPAITRF